MFLKYMYAKVTVSVNIHILDTYLQGVREKIFSKGPAEL